ncbi:unnamed protein product [Strongylus vulgaris]|uniref:Uncharacterized protein n=1 Tax=Strongylus vulgaris TaxID=40348 RepID=A0A3P7JB52_STRVU|nr:unnamed protein product [Strongylus vulgaris]
MLELFKRVLVYHNEISQTIHFADYPRDTRHNTDDRLWCPTYQVGSQCPENSFFSYYKCCGHLHKECCSHMRVWVLLLIIGLPLLCIIPAVAYFLRRLMQKRRQRYHGGVQMAPRDTNTREVREIRTTVHK